MRYSIEVFERNEASGDICAGIYNNAGVLVADTVFFDEAVLKHITEKIGPPRNDAAMSIADLEMEIMEFRRAIRKMITVGEKALGMPLGDGGGV